MSAPPAAGPALGADAAVGSSPPWRPRWWVGPLALALVVGVGLPSLPPGVRNWDNWVKLHVAQNILEGRGPILTETPPDPGYLMTGVDGRNYTGYPPAAFLLQVPTLAAARLGVLYEGIPALLLLGMTAWALFSWAGRLGIPPGGAAAGAMLACFGTMLWPMAAHGYDILVEVLALTLLLRVAAGPAPRRDWLMVGAAVGAAIATRFGAMLLAVPAGVLLVATPAAPRERWRRALWFAAGCTPGCAVVLWYNQMRFGSPLVVDPRTTGSSFAQLFVPWFSEPHWEAMVGMTLSPGKGILWYSPPLLLALLLGRRLLRLHPGAAKAVAAWGAVSIVSLGRLKTWHGEWGWGPRYLAPLCLLAAPVGWWAWDLARRRGRACQLAVAGAFLVTLAIQAAPVVGYPIESYFNFTLRPLAKAGLLVTTPITSPPLPEDNALLYFRLDTSPIVRLAQSLPDLLADPASGAARAKLALATMVPVMALAYVLLASRQASAAPSTDGARETPEGERPAT